MKKKKKVSDSAISYYPMEIFPSDLNSKGTVFGGRVLSLADKIAGYTAQRHSEMDCVTLAVDSVLFRAPAHQGEALIFKASVNRVWRTSLEVGVMVLAENFQTQENRHVLSAYFTFVALDKRGRPAPIPIGLQPKSENEKRRYSKAGKRRIYRLANT